MVRSAAFVYYLPTNNLPRASGLSIANEIAGFGDLNLFFLVILRELTIKCVIGLGKFVEILEDQWKW